MGNGTIDTPTGVPTMLKVLEKELNRLESKKADDTSVQAVRAIAEEAKHIAISARDKSIRPHECLQLEMMHRIEQELSGWKKIKVISLVAGVCALVAASAFLVTLNISVQTSEANVVEMRSTVRQLESSTLEVRKALEAEKLRKQDEEIQRFENLKMLILSMKSKGSERISELKEQ